jgi:hypothetical protein
MGPPKLRNGKFSEDNPGEQVDSDVEIVSNNEQPPIGGGDEQVNEQLAGDYDSEIEADDEGEENEGNPEMSGEKSDKFNMSILKGIQALPDLLIGMTEILQQTRSEIGDLKIHKAEINQIVTDGQREQTTIFCSAIDKLNTTIESTQKGQTEQCKLITTMIDNQKRLTTMLENQNRLFSNLNGAINKLMSSQEQQFQSLEKTLKKNSSKVTDTLAQVVAKVYEMKSSPVVTTITETPPLTPPDMPATLVVGQSSKFASPASVSRKILDKHRHDGSDSESESSDTEIKSAVSATSRSSTSSCKGHRRPKIPSYTGSELWEIWINRFSDIAKRQGWSEDEKLDEVLPRLQGEAGEFAYGQLPEEVRCNYPKLIAELTSRFQKVETPKTYGKKFASRVQRVGDSVEAFAADLKRLYDKAYKGRPDKTRQEDLLRQFFDGLDDVNSKGEIEFHKNPQTLDEAVALVVNYQETCQMRDLKVQSDGSRRATINAKAEPRVVQSDSDSDEAARVTRTQVVTENKQSSTNNVENSGDKLLTEMLKGMKEMAESIKAIEHRGPNDRSNGNGKSKQRKPNHSDNTSKPDSGQNGNNGFQGQPTGRSANTHNGNNTQNSNYQQNGYNSYQGRPNAYPQSSNRGNNSYQHDNSQNNSYQHSGNRGNNTYQQGNNSYQQSSSHQQNGAFNNSGTSGGASNIICYSCGVPGHISRLCPNSATNHSQNAVNSNSGGPTSPTQSSNNNNNNSRPSN